MKCDTCNGTGWLESEDYPFIPCPDCDTLGEVEICPVCKGTKRIKEQWLKGILIYDEPCSECDERGVV